MNCRFAPIDARIHGVTLAFVGIRMPIGVALPHSPGEGSGGSS
jgi:hypothetical protein